MCHNLGIWYQRYATESGLARNCSPGNVLLFILSNTFSASSIMPSDYAQENLQLTFQINRKTELQTLQSKHFKMSTTFANKENQIPTSDGAPKQQQQPQQPTNEQYVSSSPLPQQSTTTPPSTGPPNLANADALTEAKAEEAPLEEEDPAAEAYAHGTADRSSSSSSIHDRSQSVSETAAANPKVLLHRMHQTYISPSDTIMSPATAKLTAFKNKHLGKG
jgi:hypothetical protein